MAPGRSSNPPDFSMVLAVLALLLLGLVLVYSSSYYLSARYFDDPSYLWGRQLLATLIGVILLFLLANLDYRYLRQIDDLLLLGALGLTLITLIPGPSSGGRWLLIGPLHFQPSELLKLALIVYMSSTIIRRGERMTSFSEGVLPYLIILGIAAGLLIAQPDLGMALIYSAIVFFMLLVGRARIAHLLACSLAGLPFVYLLLHSSSYRWGRIVSFINPFKYGEDRGYQLLQSLTAIGSGGLFGRGLGLGREKLLYLPSAHNDFIVAVVGEELGFLGELLLIGLFGFILWRGLAIVGRAPDRFGFLLGSGLVFALGLQAALNLGVAAGVLPVTGLTLPFISYGGSSLIVSLAMTGILLNISKQGKEGELAGLGGRRGERRTSLPLPRNLRGFPRPRGKAARLHWG
ncbi:MAG: putative lipid II flippase FtsW [Candidatus Bipolaricaulia bacterium]